MRAEIFGCPVDILTMNETIEIAREAMQRRTTTVHVALNVAKLVNMRSDPMLAADVKNSDLVGIDGMGILLAARLLGLPAKERVAGVDLLQELLGVCAMKVSARFSRRYSRACFGRLAQQSLPSILQSTSPACAMATLIGTGGRRSSRRSATAERIVCSSECRRHARSDFWPRTATNLGVPFIMGVGGSFDVLAGVVTRAPASDAKAWARMALSGLSGAAPDVVALLQDEHHFCRHDAFRPHPARAVENSKLLVVRSKPATALHDLVAEASVCAHGCVT